MEFQQRLNELRKRSGLSQEELANLLGVTRQAVQKWEAGSSKPDMDNLMSLSRYFGVSLDWLVTGQDATPATTAQPVVVEQHHYHSKIEYEYKSQATWFGLPLVHVKLGNGLCWAKGVIAIGNMATGVVAIGGVSAGLFSLGGVSLALLLGLGGLCLGGIALGGMAVGGIALGGCAIGWFALGGFAQGVYAAGGMALASQVAVGDVANAALAIGRRVSGANTLLVSGQVTAQEVAQAIAQHAPHTPLWVSNFLSTLASYL